MIGELIVPRKGAEKAIGSFDCGVYIFADGTRVLSATPRSIGKHVLLVTESDGSIIRKPEEPAYSFTDRIAGLAVHTWEETGELPAI